MIVQKRIAIMGLLFSFGGFCGMASTEHKLFAYSFMLGCFAIVALCIYKLILISRGKEKWGVF